MAAGGSASWMRRDRDDGYLFFGGTVEPENAVGAWCLVFCIGLKDVLAIWTSGRRVFVSFQAGMAWIGLQVAQRFLHRFQPLCLRPVFPQFAEV